jgi:hypothetical protein
MATALSANANFLDGSRFNPFRSMGPKPLQGGYPIFRMAVYSPQNLEAPKSQYTFPISPSQYSKEIVSLSTMYNTPAASLYGGIARIIDQYGTTPPVWKFTGTPGYQYHALDNYQYTGNQSFQLLTEFLYQYTQQQAQNTANNSPLDLLELNDYVDNDHWYVVPVGVQNFRRSANAPLWGFYEITLAGIVPAGAGLTTQSFFLQDAVITALSEDPFTLTNQLQNFGQMIMGIYGATQLP